jgi:toxin YoeB
VILAWDASGWDDYIYWQGQDKKTLKRINALIKDALRTPYSGIGKPEHLKWLGNVWSRRINDQDRLVYKVDEASSTLTIAQCRNHY